MKKKNLEKKVTCIDTSISDKEIGLNHTTYLHPCIRNYLTKEEIGLLKRYSRNEKVRKYKK